MTQLEIGLSVYSPVSLENDCDVVFVLVELGGFSFLGLKGDCDGSLLASDQVSRRLSVIRHDVMDGEVECRGRVDCVCAAGVASDAEVARLVFRGEHEAGLLEREGEAALDGATSRATLATLLWCAVLAYSHVQVVSEWCPNWSTTSSQVRKIR